MDINIKSSIPNQDYQPHVFAKIASAIAIALGTTVLLGWAFYFWMPVNLLPVLFSIKVNTAINFVLCGIALWMLSETNKKHNLYVMQLCAAVVFLISFSYFIPIFLPY